MQKDDDKNYFALFDHISQPMVMQSSGEPILLLNQAAIKLFGLSSVETETITDFGLLHVIKQLDNNSKKLDYFPGTEVLQTGKSVHDLVVGIYNSLKNETILMLVNSELIFHEGKNAPIQVVTTFTTIPPSLKFDMGEAEKNKASLAKSEYRFSQMASQSQTVIWEVDKQGLYTYVSPIAETVWGYSPYELEGKIHFYELHPQEGRDEFKKVAFEIFERREIFKNMPNQLVTKQGVLILVSTNGIPIVDDSNSLIGYRGSNEDITKRVQFENELKKLNAQLELKVLERTNQLDELNSLLLNEIIERNRIKQDLIKTEESYQTVVENVNEIIFQTDAEGHWLFLNKSWERVTGFTQEESLGQLFVDFVHPDDRALNWKKFEPLINREKVYCRHEIRYLTKDGGFKWVEVFARLGLNEKNEITGTYGSLKDITEQKKVLELLLIKTGELEKFFSLALDLMLVTDANGIILKTNNAWELILGYSLTELANKNIFEYVHPEDKHATINMFRLSINQIPVLRFTCRIRSKFGTYHLIEWHTSKQMNTYYSIARDITEKKKIVDKIIKSGKESDLANRAKSEFLSRVSHDFRTPLNAILGFAQLIGVGELSPDQIKGVANIKQSGKYLLDLINGMLDIAQIESGKIAIKLQPVKLMNTIHEIVDIISPLAFEKGIEIQFVHSKLADLLVKSNHQILMQVLMNLVSNAIKYNRINGKIYIQVTKPSNQINGRDPVRISIIDTGIGISKENMTKLFVPFERIGAEKTKEEGTGLGLSVVYKLVEAMEGHVGVESIVGGGSTFWVELWQVESHLEKDEENENIEKIDIPLDVKTRTMLYVDDDQPCIELVDKILKSKRPNVNLKICIYGSQALKIAQKIKPAIILLNLNTTDIDAKTVIRNLKSETETKMIPIILLCSCDSINQFDEVIKKGVISIVAKPIDVPQFLEVIDSYLFEKVLSVESELEQSHE